MQSEGGDTQAPLRRQRTRAVFVGAAVLLGAIFLWEKVVVRPSAAAARPAPTGAVPVETALARRADIPIDVEGLGTVQAFYTVKITPRVDGELLKVGFVEGQLVKKGALLAQIDPRPYQAALEQAIATRDKDTDQLANAQHDLERYESLAPEDLVSRQTLDTQRALVAQLKAQLEGDRAAIDAARTQLDYTTITSPIGGRTGIRTVDPGNVVHASDATGIVIVTEMQPISVVFTLPEDDLAEVNRALAQGPVRVAALQRDGATELDRGTISVVDNEIDPATGTMRLKATFPNPHDRLWPGQFVKVRMRLGIERQALTVPSAAIQRGSEGEFAYVVGPDSTVAAQPVATGLESGPSIVVEKGLQDGSRVVTSNQFRLQPGVRVRVVEPATQAPAGGAPGDSR